MRYQPITISQKRLVLVLAGIMLGMSLGALDQTVVGTAMPRVIAELNGMEHYAWVFAAYMLASTVMIPIYGKLSDIYGRRPFFLGGMLLFLLGSALSGASPRLFCHGDAGHGAHGAHGHAGVPRDCHP